MEELAGPQWWLDRKGEVPAGMQPFFRLPILHYYQVGCPARLPGWPACKQLVSSARSRLLRGCHGPLCPDLVRVTLWAACCGPRLLASWSWCLTSWHGCSAQAPVPAVLLDESLGPLSSQSADNPVCWPSPCQLAWLHAWHGTATKRACSHMLSSAGAPGRVLLCNLLPPCPAASRGMPSLRPCMAHGSMCFFHTVSGQTSSLSVSSGGSAILVGSLLHACMLLESWQSTSRRSAAPLQHT